MQSNTIAAGSDYHASHVETDDLVTVTVDVAFIPPMPVGAGMVALDISVPTGFAPVSDTLDDHIYRV